MKRETYEYYVTFNSVKIIIPFVKEKKNSIV